jgi:hypothetical protein
LLRLQAKCSPTPSPRWQKVPPSPHSHRCGQEAGVSPTTPRTPLSTHRESTPSPHSRLTGMATGQGHRELLCLRAYPTMASDRTGSWGWGSPNTHPQGAAGATAGVGRTTAFSGHLLAHLCSHRSERTGRRSCWGTGKPKQWDPENPGFGANRFILRKNPG